MSDEEKKVTDQAQETLKWRLPVEARFSDWEIEIKTNGSDANEEQKDDSIVANYNVHRVFLASSTRKSTYFEGVFNLESMKESVNSKTCLELEKSAAEAFPAFLDYIYGCDLKISVGSAVALRHLADYFGVQPIKPIVFSFINKDIRGSRSNVHIYCREALIYKDTDTIDLLIDVVGSLYGEDVIQGGNEGPVISMSKILSEDQRNKLYFHALKASHVKLSNTNSKLSAETRKLSTQSNRLSNVNSQLSSTKRQLSDANSQLSIANQKLKRFKQVQEYSDTSTDKSKYKYSHGLLQSGASVCIGKKSSPTSVSVSLYHQPYAYGNSTPPGKWMPMFYYDMEA